MRSDKPRDVTIFYDGTNEVYHWIFYGNAIPEIARRFGSSHESSTWYERATFWVWKNFRNQSEFVRRFCNVNRNRRWTVPVHLRNEHIRRRLLKQSQVEFRTALIDASSVSRKSGAKFVHFLQPTLFSQARLSVYEAQLARNHNIVFAGLEVAHRRGYEALRQELASIEGLFPSFDLGDAFDDRRDRGEYFIDDCHVTHEANAVVARRIARAVIEEPGIL